MVIYGAGPVGLMAAISARLRGASDVFVIDRQPDRLKLVEALDATPIDDSAGDAVQQVLEPPAVRALTGASRPSDTRPMTTTGRKSPA